MEQKEKEEKELSILNSDSKVQTMGTTTATILRYGGQGEPQKLLKTFFKTSKCI